MLGGLFLLMVAVVVGCHPRHADLPAHHHATASADGPAVVPPGVVLTSPTDLVVGLRHAQHVLALSSGGLYGAYSAGVLDGWSRTGTRPEFDVVTGSSTGAFIAPFAFLGSEYDAQAMKLYTSVQAEDIFRVRAWVTIPFRDAMATSAPLRQLIQSQVNQELMERIAAEHRKGRRLYVGTTDLRTKRAVIWDMGAIASRPCPEGCTLFRDVLLASGSVPGVFPPVPFEIEVDGRRQTELHVDGAITAPLFMPPGVFAAAAVQNGPVFNPNPLPGRTELLRDRGRQALSGRRVGPPPHPAGTCRHDEALLYAQCRAELANMYWQSRLSGMRVPHDRAAAGREHRHRPRGQVRPRRHDETLPRRADRRAGRSAVDVRAAGTQPLRRQLRPRRPAASARCPTSRPAPLKVVGTRRVPSQYCA